MLFPNVRDVSLRAAWEESEAFNRFRGTGWMPEPCRGCERAERDWGGCRCQAFALTGDAAATDPACALSPDHGLLAAAVAEAGAAVPPELAPTQLFVRPEAADRRPWMNARSIGMGSSPVRAGLVGLDAERQAVEAGDAHPLHRCERRHRYGIPALAANENVAGRPCPVGDFAARA